MRGRRMLVSLLASLTLAAGLVAGMRTGGRRRWCGRTPA